MRYSPEEIAGFESQLELLVRKLNFMQMELGRAIDPNVKFTLTEEISQLERQISDLKYKLSAAHGLPTINQQEVLDAAIRKLNIDEEEEIGLLHLVNCDRHQMVDKFWSAFDEKEEEHFQFYFITGCPTQMPPSFAERMVYELLVEELDSESDALHILTNEESGRLRIQDLPLGRNTRKSQQRFKAYVQERFRFADTQSFDAFIETGVPNLSYDYVAVVFELHERKWSDFIPEYLEWMIETFKCPNKQVPKFLFFFVFYLEGQHLGGLESKQKEIITSLSELTVRHETTLLTPLLPVEDGDLKAWLMDLGERNPNQVQVVIDALVSTLREEDQVLFRDKRLFNMKDIEELQALIYKIANE